MLCIGGPRGGGYDCRSRLVPVLVLGDGNREGEQDEKLDGREAIPAK